MGESAGATIAHYVAVRAGTTTGLEGLRVRGAVIRHPYLAGSEPDPLMRVLVSGEQRDG